MARRNSFYPMKGNEGGTKTIKTPLMMTSVFDLTCCPSPFVPESELSHNVEAHHCLVPNPGHHGGKNSRPTGSKTKIDYALSYNPVVNIGNRESVRSHCFSASVASDVFAFFKCERLRVGELCSGISPKGLMVGLQALPVSSLTRESM